MTEAPTKNGTTSQNGAADTDESDDSVGSITDFLPTDRLKEAAQALLKAATDRAVNAALEQVEGLSGRLGDVAENGGVGLTSAFLGGGDGDEGDEGDDNSGRGIGGAIKSGFSTIKDKVTGALGIGGGDSDSESGGSGGGGGTAGARGKFKFMNIYEMQDVGVPIRVAYDQWTQFADFPSFMKKVENVDQSADEKISWKAQVFWSHRTWETTIVEQVPDSHILWTSSGAKGRADGFVSFGEIAPNMTKIVLILEYYPQGLFEKTGNIWRAVGRRARLEFKHFCRHVMMDTLVNRDDLEGWRGEIRDSEVVKTHEEALEEEREAAEDSEDSEEAQDLDEYDEDAEPEDDEFVAEDEEPEDEEDDLDDEPTAEYASDDDLDEPEDVDEDAEPEDVDEDAEPEDVDEDAEDVDDDAEPEDVEEPEPEVEERPRRRSRRTQPA